MFEETGLKAKSVHLGPWTNDIMDKTKHYITLFVLVSQFEESLKLKEIEKCEGWNWFDWQKLPNPLFLPFHSLIEKLGPNWKTILEKPMCF